MTEPLFNSNLPTRPISLALSSPRLAICNPFVPRAAPQPSPTLLPTILPTRQILPTFITLPHIAIGSPYPPSVGLYDFSPTLWLLPLQPQMIAIHVFLLIWSISVPMRYQMPMYEKMNRKYNFIVLSPKLSNYACVDYAWSHITHLVSCPLKIIFFSFDIFKIAELLLNNRT